MGISSRRDQNRIEQRARILESARLLFGSRGYDEATVTDVARAAGVARATVFNYFASKPALVDAMAEEVLDDYAAMLEQAQDLGTTPVPTLLRAIAEQMGLGIEEVRQFNKGVFEQIVKMQLGLEAGRGASRLRVLTVDRLAGVMRRGQERAEVAENHTPEDLAYAFDGLMHGAIAHWLYDDPSKSLSERMGRASDVFLGGIALGPSAARSGDVLPNLRDPDLR